MIIGIGHDLVEIARIERILQGHTAEMFIRRILTEEEIALAPAGGKRLAEYAAGRFAVKEAVSKALGCGIGAAVRFIDIHVLPDRLGKPTCTLSARAWERLGLDPTATRIHVTITHERGFASAFAVAERR
ncbi:Holo-[acyl-carrier-protein] synthase [Thermobacillus xylanilyticus]|uniref:Holo-[acyl-carrier-protein] synthase n=1 Tax=Thermobacillus xylanilyticus TaxID=76633 RepID=A0ABM8UZH0_THEXY|nr:holo-ACP synthase [Thermobacillus xylanilyticus]REJ12244.1 MAG: holo-[acyl-carrier-protein] synthase [Paenibacillaceae bacterium]CAG5076692.1 Holo-[acyl-carrier-protein] synthase [Thermobacillus xylanilyticus]